MGWFFGFQLCNTFLCLSAPPWEPLHCLKAKTGMGKERRLAEFAQLKLLEDFGGGEEAGVDDAGDGEGAADDGAHRRHEVVQRRPRLVVLHRNRV